MKKLLLLITLVGCAVMAKAQTYHKFKFDIGLGYAIPSSDGGNATTNVKAGATFTLEPHYRITDALAVGIRFEGAGLGYGNTDDGENSNVKVQLLTSYCPTLEYYLMSGGFRPFIGAGAGIYSQQSAEVNENTTEDVTLVAGGSKFGFFPRAGFEAGHFRLSAEYNFLGSTSSYAAFKIGFFFGGGKK